MFTFTEVFSYTLCLITKVQYSEAQLITFLTEKNENAFNILYNNYSPTLYGIVLRIVNSEEAAQDVLQDSFVKIWQVH